MKVQSPDQFRVEYQRKATDDATKHVRQYRKNAKTWLKLAAQSIDAGEYEVAIARAQQIARELETLL
jgi:hypothetical protein